MTYLTKINKFDQYEFDVKKKLPNNVHFFNVFKVKNMF